MSQRDINEVESMSSRSVSEVTAAMSRHAKKELENQRDLGTVTTEIRTLHRQAQQMVLSYAIEIGRRLTEAKALVEYGGWGAYIKEELGYSQSTANNFMRLFDEYGKSQQSLFGGETESQTFGNLTYSQALALLALPAEEREEFVESHDVTEMSTRELEAAIKERDQAKAELDKMKASNDELFAAVADAEDELDAEKERAKVLEKELKELKARPVDVAVEAADPEEIKKAVDAAVAAEREKAKEAADKAKEKQKQLEAKLKEAEKKSQGAEAGANAEVEELRRQLAMADPVTAEFKGLFAQAGQLVARLLELAAQAPEDKRPNLTAALAALGRQLGGDGGTV